MALSQFEIEVSGRISALEYVLECMLANELSFQPPEHTAKFKEDMLGRPGYIKSGPVDVDQMQAIAAALHTSLEYFLQKVTKREDEIRALRLAHQ
jgi:hypothetical protein